MVGSPRATAIKTLGGDPHNYGGVPISTVSWGSTYLRRFGDGVPHINVDLGTGVPKIRDPQNSMTPVLAILNSFDPLCVVSCSKMLISSSS